MSFICEIQPTEKNMVAFGTGDLYESDIRLLSQRLRTDPVFDPTYSLLIDLTNVGHLHLPAANLETLADAAGPESSKRALVAPDDAWYQSAVEHQHADSKLAVFRSAAEAKRWLEIA